MQVTPPSNNKNWTTYLPSPFDDDPTVVVRMAPVTCQVKLKEVVNGPSKGTKFACYEYEGVQYPLALVDAAHPDYFDNLRMMRNIGMPVETPPAYVGPLSEIPNKLLASADWMPLIFQKEHYHRPVFNLKMWMWQLTKEVAKAHGYSD